MRMLSKTAVFHFLLLFQILIFPEGTNFCEWSKGRSDAFAKKEGLELYNYGKQLLIT
jgi:hypothetical protein